jgi:hypothetical protein
MESPSRFSSLFAHDLFGKPASAFPDHALAAMIVRRPGMRLTPAGFAHSGNRVSIAQ